MTETAHAQPVPLHGRARPPIGDGSSGGARTGRDGSDGLVTLSEAVAETLALLAAGVTPVRDDRREQPRRDEHWDDGRHEGHRWDDDRWDGPELAAAG
jgi:hypothetical protein